MKIKIYKPNSPLSAYNQFVEEFERLGHEVTDNNPDVLLHLSGFFQEVIEDSKKFPNAVKAGILLDANPEDPSWPEKETREQLLQLDLKMTISDTSRKQILKRTGVNCDIVYYPMKPVQQETLHNSGFFLWVGRLFSKNKRFSLVYPTLNAIDYDPENLVIAGPENSPFGFNTGVISNDDLNALYNSCEFVVCLSSTEGICLPMIEGAVLGRNLILCNDLETVHEFGLQDFAADPDPLSLAQKITHIKNNPEFYQDALDKLRPGLVDKFKAENVVKRILNLYYSHKESKV